MNRERGKTAEADDERAETNFDDRKWKKNKKKSQVLPAQMKEAEEEVDVT